MIYLGNVTLAEGDVCVECKAKATLNLDGLDLCLLHFSREGNYLPSETQAIFARLTNQASQIGDCSDQLQITRSDMNGIICTECITKPFRSGGMIIRKVIPKEGPAHDAGLCRKHYRMSLQSSHIKSANVGQLATAV
jgi:hypothetical protein